MRQKILIPSTTLIESYQVCQCVAHTTKVILVQGKFGQGTKNRYTKQSSKAVNFDSLAFVKEPKELFSFHGVMVVTGDMFLLDL